MLYCWGMGKTSAIWSDLHVNCWSELSNINADWTGVTGFIYIYIYIYINPPMLDFITVCPLVFHCKPTYGETWPILYVFRVWVLCRVYSNDKIVHYSSAPLLFVSRRKCLNWLCSRHSWTQKRRSFPLTRLNFRPKSLNFQLMQKTCRSVSRFNKCQIAVAPNIFWSVLVFLYAAVYGNVLR